MEFQQELSALLEGVEEGDLWRSLEDVRTLLDNGSPGTTGDRLTPAFAKLDLEGKRVADIGCNVGYYTFLATLMGAASVKGFDHLEQVLAVGRLFAERFRAERPEVRAAHFLTGDFYTFDPGETYETVMVIDVIGNTKVGNGEALPLIDRFIKCAEKEFVLTMRPIFPLGKHLSREAAEKLYPGPHLRDGQLHFLGLLQSRLNTTHESWDMDILSEEIPSRTFDKHLVRFRRV